MGGVQKKIERTGERTYPKTTSFFVFLFGWFL
jgi:hypothetical protein